MPGGNRYNPFTDRVLWILIVVCGIATLAAFGRLDDVVTRVLAFFAALFVP